MYFPVHFNSTEFNWGYKSDPEKGACLGLNGGVWSVVQYVIVCQKSNISHR